MDISIGLELRTICEEIEGKNLNPDQWAEIESDDMFQSIHFIGGFDADEYEFCFSFIAQNKMEYWFQFNLETALKISKGSNPVLIGRLAE